MNKAKHTALILGATLLPACAPNLPNLQTAGKAVWLEQNWSAPQRDWFHHAVQGTATLPVPHEWFMALEQPELKPFGEPGLLSDNAYLLRFGFISSPSGKDNPGGLPIGFAVDKDFKDPVTGQSLHALGFTCAACHTGHFNYKGTEVRIDGGPAVTDVPRLLESLVFAMVYTRKVPFRFDRFAQRVLGRDSTADSRHKLETEFGQALENLLRIAKLEKSVAAGSVEEGFARLDALHRIGNQVFGYAFKDSNYHSTDAPVSYPHIWSTSWFDWVQYDGSIMQPMVRNAGEALGVASGINLRGAEQSRFASTVKVETLYELEKLLAGDQPPTDGKRFTGLRAPKWPEEILGRIDRTKAERGKALYSQYCQDCHLPPPDSQTFWDDRYWTVANRAGQRYLQVKEIPIAIIGTDPMQAKALTDRTVDTQGMGLDTTVLVLKEGRCEPFPIKDDVALPYGPALGAVVQETVHYYYDQHGIPAEQRSRLDGYRPNCLDASMQYKARPLDGIWATPPYLHNGAVPNLYALLSPAGERPAFFYLGNQEFDPVQVGYESGAFGNGFRLDTTLPGNSNRGHEFDDAATDKGVIGPRLTPEQRMTLIEYLKTL